MIGLNFTILLVALLVARSRQEEMYVFSDIVHAREIP